MKSYNEQLGEVVWKYIDRMSDTCDVDTAEQILEEFVEECIPIMMASIASKEFE